MILLINSTRKVVRTMQPGDVAVIPRGTNPWAGGLGCWQGAQDCAVAEPPPAGGNPIEHALPVLCRIASAGSSAAPECCSNTRCCAAPAALPKPLSHAAPCPWLSRQAARLSCAAAGVGHYFANANCDPITMLVLFNSKNPARVYPMTEMMALPSRVLTGGCGRHCCRPHCGAGRCLRWWLQTG